MSDQNLINTLLLGGWTVYPLFLCSLLSLAIIIERIFFGHKKGNSIAKIKKVIEEKNNDKNLAEAIEVQGRKEVIKFLRYTNVLGIIAAISPLLGLLGTVSGMIKTFSTIETQGLGNATALAGGISEALVSTAFGLSVAIPSLIFYRYQHNKARKFSVELEEAALELTN